MNYTPSSDKIKLPEPVCMDCSKICKRWEVVYTGEEESDKGFEVWNYCPDCDVETFHLINPA